MFDFLFKRRSAATVSSIQANDLQAAEAGTRAQARQEAREQAARQAAALSDEQSALAFIVQCEFAEARLQAAQWLQSTAALTEALRAIRNSDRRVAKLLQARLDGAQRRQRAQAQMQEVLEQAEALLRDPMLTPDRVADVDRAWEAAVAGNVADENDAAPAAAMSAMTAFTAAREALRDRLAAQTQLQRSLIDTRLQLQKIQSKLHESYESQAAPNDDCGESDAELNTASAVLDNLQRQIAQDRDAPEAAAMPKQLLPDCERLLEECRAEHARRAADAAAQLLRSEQATAADLQEIPPEASQDISQNQPQIQEETPPPKPERRTKQVKQTMPAASPEQLSQWLDLLAQLEAALEQGALQAASEAERTLRDIDVRALKPAAAAVSRLNAAYASLHHLQGWARWGGNISREELLQTALALPELALPVPELVQKIGGLRARWKLLSVSAGPAPQALWLQFDAACSTAYAPAAALFEQQDREREENRALAEALIAEAALFAQQQETTITALALDNAADDAGAGMHPAWKQLAQFDTRMRQAWQRLGPLGHKEKRVLERAFNAALNAVQAPLRQRQKIEIKARQMLIAEVAALAADDRQTVDALRRIQAEWQQRAQGLPLARKDEQALWQAFRVACDGVFAQRKEAAANQDAQRQTQLQEKQTVCAQLEDALAGADDDAAAMQNILQQAQTAWSRIGPAPRAVEREIEQRFRDASGALQRRLHAAKDQAAAAAMAAEAAQIDARLTLCFALEGSLSRGGLTAEDAEAWRARWQAAPHLSRTLEQVLTQRFEAALAGIDPNNDGGDENYLQQLQRQRPDFDNALLEAEIALGLDSPPQLARQRMQLQVALLQSSLKAGAVMLSGQQQLARLCALPAVPDQPTLARVGEVVRRALQGNA